MNTIFVYGTLKREHGNYARFIAPDTTHNFIGEAVSTSRDYAMISYGAPMLFKGVPNGHPVKGELYEVSDEAFARIDRLEGHPRVYRREQQFFTTTDGWTVPAWVYLSSRPFPSDYPDDYKNDPPINNAGQLVWPRPGDDQ